MSKLLKLMMTNSSVKKEILRILPRTLMDFHIGKWLKLVEVT